VDCSKIYINMCEKAREIQKLLQYDAGNFFYCPEDEECIVFPPTMYSWTNKDYLWLPRQDQLQDMIPLKSKFHRIVDKLYDFNDWIELNAIYVSSDCSFEQLWLGFVMKNNYNKHWDWKNNKWTK